MDALGHPRFGMVGHDRGARIAYRMALDRPDRVSRLAVLNVVPTIDQFERMGAGLSLGYWPWFLLAQPAPFPERLISGPAGRISWLHLRLLGRSGARRSRPRRSPPTLAGSTTRRLPRCAPTTGRASGSTGPTTPPTVRAGRRIECPILVLTGDAETQLADAGEVWAAWAHDVRAATVPGGHFIPEEAAEQLAAALLDFLG